MTFDPSTYNSPQFLKLLLAHLFRDASVLKKARDVKLTEDDFVISDSIGLQVYRELAEIALRNPDGHPAPYEIVEMVVQDKIVKQEILPQQSFLAKDIIKELYAGEVNQATAEFVGSHLFHFIKQRREAKAMLEHKDNPDALFDNLSRIRTEIKQVEKKEQKYMKNIFAQNKMPDIISFIPTGIPELDSLLGGGLGVGEYAQILGFSGGGKTTLGVTLVSNAAMAGYNAVYVSREEGEGNITNRFRAKNFGLSYSKLRSGLITGCELDQITEEKADIRDLLTKHMRLLDVRDYGEFTAQSLVDELEKAYREEGFIASVVVIDQLDYMAPCVPKKGEQEWEKYSRMAFEMDTVVSHHLIGGKHPVSIWLLHQAKGKEKRIFTIEEITGFKGIVKPADLVLGIGRNKDEFNLFTLKARHGPRFELPMESNLEYMEFIFSGQKKAGGNMFQRDSSLANTGNSRNIFATNATT